MACKVPATGAKSAVYIIEEQECGVTPNSPQFTRLRINSGGMSPSREVIASAELDGSGEMSRPTLGNLALQGEIVVPMAHGNADLLLESALKNSYTTPSTEAGVTITINATAKTATRGAGEFTSYEVGSYLKFDDLDLNKSAYRIKSINGDVLTLDVSDNVLKDESKETGITTDSKLVLGNTEKHFTLVEIFNDLDDDKKYQIYRGVECVGFSFSTAVNTEMAMTLNLIGRTYETVDALPEGHGLNDPLDTKTFKSTLGRIMKDGEEMGLVSSMEPTLDTSANPLYEVFKDTVSAIERGRANHTFSISTYFDNQKNFEQWTTEKEASMLLEMRMDEHVMSLFYPQFVLQTVERDRGSEGAIVENLTAQAYADSQDKTALIIRKI